MGVGGWGAATCQAHMILYLYLSVFSCPGSSIPTPCKDNRQEPADNRQELVDNHQEPVDNRQEPVDNRQEPGDNRQEPEDNRQEPLPL